MPQKNKNTPQKLNITCNYIFSDNYDPTYVNGAIGGINPAGEIVVNFYFERAPVPIKEKYEVGLDNKLNRIEEYRGDSNPGMVRTVKTGVILNLQQAKDINIWLKEKIDTLEELLKQQKNG